jgi:predicted O-linked N-acetylglucosamine transferase (SPINDLY family)
MANNQPYALLSGEGQEPFDEWMRLGVQAQIAEKLEDAQRHYLRALRLQPNHAAPMMNLAIVYSQLKRYDRALLEIERASMFGPQYCLVWSNWCFILLDMELVDQAIEKAQKALEVDPTSIQSKRAMANALHKAGRAQESLKYYAEILAESPADDQACSHVAFIETYSGNDVATVQGSRDHWYKHHSYKGIKYPHANNRERDRALRVGYVGGDFRRHSAAFVFGNVIFNHDKKRVVPYCYSTVNIPDDYTDRFKAAAEWRDVENLDEPALEAMIRKDEIDILVDLSGHTIGNRLNLFTRKPAPVQVTAWGFACGTGIPEIDYFFADRVVVPESERQFYAEKIYDLPSVVTYTVPKGYLEKDAPKPPARQRDPGGIFTFGYFGRFDKISDACFETWAEILNAVPMSRMLFKDVAFHRPDAIRRVQSQMKVNPARLLFMTDTSHPDHMLAYQLCDLVLDSFPPGGGVTSLENCYMGVPVVTLYGKNPSERITSAILTAIGRKEWIAETRVGYRELAIRLANQPESIHKARKTLRQELLQSPILVGYVEAVEDAYHDMWRKYLDAR